MRTTGPTSLKTFSGCGCSSRSTGWARHRQAVSSLLRDKWVTFAHEMNFQAPSGLSFVMVSNTWTRLSLEERVVGSSTLVLACRPCASTCVCRCWSWARFKGVDDEFFTTPNGEEFWEPYDHITGFIVNQLHLEVGITGTMPSRKTRLRSSLA